VGLLSAKQDEEVMAEINITPFTDVLLVLLIIFMILAALVAPPGFEKELPNKNNNNQANENKNKNDIEVDVNNRGVIFVDGTKTNEAGVYSVMGAVSKKKPNHHVAIIADAKAPYGVIIRILDAAKLAGLEDVGFVTSS
jgi:biopolymer transport protein ExbD